MEPVRVGTGPYAWKMRHGPSLYLGSSEVDQVGEHRGIPMFAKASEKGTPSVVYFLVRPGCEFQPYQANYTVGEVRG